VAGSRYDLTTRQGHSYLATASLRKAIEKAGRVGRDVAKSLTWDDVNSVILETPLNDRSFALDGIRTMRDEIKRAEIRIVGDWSVEES
jgi:hypothetical protein